VNNVEIFRPRGSIVAAYLAYVVIAIMVTQTILTSSVHESLVGAIWGSFTATLSYLILHRPKIELFDEGVRITNPFEEITVGWQLVESIDTKYTMSIQIGGKSIHAWAATAPGRYHGRTIHPSEMRGLNVGADGIIRPGDSPRSHSGAASYLANLRLKSFRDRQSDNGCDSRVVFNKTGLIVLITSALLGTILNFYHF